MKIIWIYDEEWKDFYALHNQTIRADKNGNVYGGGSEAEVPAPTPEETENVQLQNKLIKQYIAEEEAISPYLAELSGYRKLTDSSGKISYQKLTAEEKYALLNPDEKLSYDVQKAASERLLKAVKGELSIDPAFDDEYSRRKVSLQEDLIRQGLTPGDTGYNEAVADFEAEMALARQNIRYGEMSTMDAVSQSQTNELLRKQEMWYTKAAGLSGGSLGSVSMLNTPLARYQKDREIAAQVGIANAQSSSPWGAIGSIFGTALGGFTGGLGGGFGFGLGKKGG
jgi:hypothetical protein